MQQVTTKLSPGAETEGPSGEKPKSPNLSAPSESLGVLERADNLLHEIAASMWLSIASVWRIPRAAIAQNNIDRLQALVANRQALPSRLALLVASIVAALSLALLLPLRTAHLPVNTLLSRLATTSPENWLLVAGPAMISLWLTTVALGFLLRKAGGVGSSEPTGVLMLTLSAVTILSCLGIHALLYADAWLDSVRRGLTDLILITGFWLMMAFLAVVGWRCARQMTPASVCSHWRRKVLLVVGPMIFVSSLVVALVGTYWLVQAQAWAEQVVDEDELPSSPSAHSATCYFTAESVVCQVLLSAHSDLAIGAVRQVDIEWRDLTRRGQSEKFSLLQERSQIVQLSPHAEPGGFWMLRAKQPTPFAFQIAMPDACRLYQQIATFRHTVKQLDSTKPQSLAVTFTIYWWPGFGLTSRRDAAASLETRTEEFADPAFDDGLADLCEKTGWRRQKNSPGKYHQVFFATPRSGWVVGPGFILHTDDGGTNWKTQKSNTTEYRSIFFVTPQSGWVVGDGIIHTEDGGRSWTEQKSNTTWILNSVFFATPQSGWAVGSFDIFHTNNGGGTWVKQYHSPAFLTSAFFATSKSGWVVGAEGTILHTEDGGTTWMQQKSGTHRSLHSVAFVTPKLGWIVGENMILHTEDSGATWREQKSGFKGFLSVAFPTPRSGWVVGRSGIILHTEDGGATWMRQKSGTTDMLSSIAFPMPQSGWAVGDGSILHWSPESND